MRFWPRSGGGERGGPMPCGSGPAAVERGARGRGKPLQCRYRGGVPEVAGSPSAADTGTGRPPLAHTPTSLPIVTAMAPQTRPETGLQQEIKDSILETVGETPLVRLSRIGA